MSKFPGQKKFEDSNLSTDPQYQPTSIGFNEGVDCLVQDQFNIKVSRFNSNYPDNKYYKLITYNDKKNSPWIERDWCYKCKWHILGTHYSTARDTVRFYAYEKQISPDPDNGTGTKKGCFIATHTYGKPPENFYRVKAIMPKKAVNFYYKISPALCKILPREVGLFVLEPIRKLF